MACTIGLHLQCPNSLPPWPNSPSLCRTEFRVHYSANHPAFSTSAASISIWIIAIHHLSFIQAKLILAQHLIRTICWRNGGPLVQALCLPYTCGLTLKEPCLALLHFVSSTRYRLQIDAASHILRRSSLIECRLLLFRQLLKMELEEMSSSTRHLRTPPQLTLWNGDVTCIR